VNGGNVKKKKRDKVAGWGGGGGCYNGGSYGYGLTGAVAAL